MTTPTDTLTALLTDAIERITAGDDRAYLVARAAYSSAVGRLEASVVELFDAVVDAELERLAA